MILVIGTYINGKKKRKLSKEELDLWKVVTKNDNRYKDYSDDVDTINNVKKKVNKTNIIKPKNIENITKNVYTTHRTKNSI